MTHIFSPQTVQYPQSAANSIKREPSEDKNYVELENHKLFGACGLRAMCLLVLVTDSNKYIEQF